MIHVIKTFKVQKLNNRKKKKMASLYTFSSQQIIMCLRKTGQHWLTEPKQTIFNR